MSQNGQSGHPINVVAESIEVSTGVSLALEHISVAFQESRVVIGDFSLSIDAGEFLVILGPSGCGKSTLLRVIARLLRPHSGSVAVVPDNPFQTAFVFQDAQLLPWRNVLDNVALPLELMGSARREREAKARQELAQVGLADVEHLYPSQLSGGMRMRVSLARALVTQPRLLLLDEPFAALDEVTRVHLDVALRKLWRARQITVVFVTHSISEAAFLGNRAVVLTRRGGIVKLDRRIDLPLDRPASFRADPRLGNEMKTLLDSMEEE